MSAKPSDGDGNNPVSRSSQNKAQLLEAMMRNVPKLKELNYTQWKNIITNSIKKAKLWEYVDGSIEEPSDHDASNLTTYYDEATAVRNAILGSLEPTAQKYIEEALDPREAWLALEKKYLTAEAEADSKLVSIEKQLADLRLEEGGDMVEHIAEFCRMRGQLSGTRLAVDDQACISMLYRSLPPSYRQSVLTPDGAEMKEFSALCARLTYLSQNPKPEAPIDDTSRARVEDYTNWGVPEDIKAFGLTGDKNPLLEERAAVTCRDCLLKGHKAGTPECPQYEWRKELWGAEQKTVGLRTNILGGDSSTEQPIPINTKRLIYEFSEPVKVVVDFDELGLKPSLKQSLLYLGAKPWAIQQCAILPIIQGRNVLVQAPQNHGKTTTLAASALQIIDGALSHPQVLVLTAAITTFEQAVARLVSGLSIQLYVCDPSKSLGTMTPSSLAQINTHHLFVGTPDYVLNLVRRNIINMREIRTVILDDIDKLIEANMGERILEIYRHIPITQVVAFSTTYSERIEEITTKLLVNPVQLLVKRNEGISIGTHFYVKLRPEQKPIAMNASFSLLRAAGAVVLCHDFSKITAQYPVADGWSHYHHYLQKSMNPNERERVLQSFRSKLSNTSGSNSGHGYSYWSESTVALMVIDEGFSITGLLNIGVPLIEYDIPSNVGDYVKRLDRWRVANPGQAHTIITFVTADTNEMQVVQDLGRYYGIHAAELLWNGSSLN
ncbi:unnamed protein product [Rhizoctonia solani]|uniref:Helicase ATP-binding domain-containing protein n=1 Tax=Rhizoctonia solani TaxID=456999 RepID=A0A8H3H9X0_9AGAM|nr:unnamed protein product [Rhizoctonia solani]